MICSPILPSCLDLRPGITFPPICTHAVVPPSLTMSSTMILVRVSRPTTSAHPCHLTSSLLPCLLAFKNRRSSKTIMRIVVPRVANVGPDDSLIFHFHGLLQMQSFPGGSRISIAYGSWPIADAIFFRGEAGYRLAGWQTRSLSGDKAEEESVDLPYHSPPTTKGRMFGMRPLDPSPPGG